MTDPTGSDPDPDLIDDVDEEVRAGSLTSDAWRQLKRRPLFWLCISIIAVLISGIVSSSQAD